jgi:tetratricopeptide (TPR) repeat protein
MYASRHEVRVCWGRCWEGEGSPTLWPWIQVVRSCIGELPDATTARPCGLENAHNLLKALTPAEAPTLSLTPVEARFRQFDLFNTTLKAIAASRPLMIILDDIHWADTTSLLLLEFLLSELRSLPVLILGLHRRREMRHDSAGMALLTNLSRHTCVKTIKLRGLSNDAMRLFINAHLTGPLDNDAFALVAKITRGNPFYLKEAIGKIVDACTPAAITSSRELQHGRGAICDVIRRRLDNLALDCKIALRVAAVVGLQFDIVLVARARCASEIATIEVLDEALRTGVVQESDLIGRYQFSHDLVRQVLYDELSPKERVELHAQVAEALEKVHGQSPIALERLAFHFSRGAVGANRVKAVGYLIAAARHAVNLCGYEQAISHYETALRIAESCELATEQCCEILLGLAEARKRAGQLENARTEFRRAANLARSVGLRVQFARSALGIADPLTAPANPDPLALCLLEEACEMLQGDETPLRVQVLGTLAVALYFSTSADRRKMLAESALEIARRILDSSAEAFALSACHHVALGSEDVERRLSIADEIIKLAADCQDRELGMRGHHFKAVDLLEMGHSAAAMAEVQIVGGLARELDHPGYRYLEIVIRGALALLYCRWDEAEALAQEARRYGIAVGDPRAEQYYGVQMCLLRWEQERLGELEIAIEEFIVKFPAIPAWRSALAFVWGSTGKLYQAQKLLDILANGKLQRLPKDALWLTALCLLAETAHRLRDKEQSRNLTSMLMSYADRVMVIGVGAGCVGAVAYFLGLLATVTDSWQEGEVYFEKALEVNQCLGAHSLIARTEYRYGEFLLKRNWADDWQKAKELLTQAKRTFAKVNLFQLAKELENRLEEMNAVGATGKVGGDAPSTGKDRVSGANFFRRQGESWLISYQGRVSRLKHRKGLEQLAMLIGSPRQEFHVLDLAGGAKRGKDAGNEYAMKEWKQQGLTVRDLGDAGPVIDARARNEYRMRFRELVREAEEAKRMNDLGHVAVVEQELSQLSRELRRCVGYRGRLRVAKAVSERARVSVKNNISAAMKEIQRTDTALWRHLMDSVRTGMFCCYDSRVVITCEAEE